MKSRLRAAHPLLLAMMGFAAGLAPDVGAGGAGAAPSLPSAAADSLPDSLGTLIYPTAAKLPPYPGDDAALLDPSRWVRESDTGSRRCVLELCVYEHGAAVVLRSAGQRKPNQSISARYLCMERGWREPHYSGPFYVWNGSDDLVERCWRTTDGKRYREDLYQYRGNGLVWAFRRRERNEDQTGSSLMIDQYFDPSGALAGFSIERGGVAADSGGGADTVSIRRVRGRQIDEAAFRKWAGEFR